MDTKNWEELCNEIIQENDSERLLSLVSQLNDALDRQKSIPKTFAEVETATKSSF